MLYKIGNLVFEGGGVLDIAYLGVLDYLFFLDLYIIGTDISYKFSKVFSYETKPDMEVAEAVRISMSIPLFFEAIPVNDDAVTKDRLTNVFVDGGVMRNYPINLFDAMNYRDQAMYGTNNHTLGAHFKSRTCIIIAPRILPGPFRSTQAVFLP